MKKQSREYRKTLDKSRILCYIRYRYVRSPKTFPPASTGGLFYVFFCFFLLDVVSFPRFASETAIFRRLFVTSHSVRYTFVPHNQTPQPLLEPVFPYIYPLPYKRHPAENLLPRNHNAPHDLNVRRSPCRPHTFLCSFYPSYRSLLINYPVRSGKAIAEPFSAYPLLPCLRIPLRHRCRSAFC